MRKYLFLLLFLLGVSVSQLHPGRAAADVGPTPINAQGGIVQPSSTTNVSMDNEKVTLTYGQPKDSTDALADSPRYMDVHVDAVFNMDNAGSAESMKVYFPSSDGDFVNGYDSKTISNFTVNGSKLTDLTDVPAGFGKEGTTIKAYQWTQNFPTGTTTLTISYDSQSSNKYGYFYLTYVLGTGRNWAGTIKKGEVDFVLPTNIPAYAVTTKPPFVKGSGLPYTLSGNTIKVAFTNYEPAADAAILFGVNDPDKIAQVEQLAAAKTQTLSSYINMGNILWSLSAGPHCVMCTDVATQADHYYNLALDKAANKTDLEKVFTAYTWGPDPTAGADNTKVLNLFTYFAPHQTCADNDNTCFDNQRELSNYPFPFSATTKAVTHADFLATYACRLRPYDVSTSVTIETYADKRLATCPIKTVSAAKTTTSVTPAKTAHKTPWLRIGLIAGGAVVVLALLITLLVVRRKHKANKPGHTKASPATDAQETTDNAQDKTNSDNRSKG